MTHSEALKVDTRGLTDDEIDALTRKGRVCTGELTLIDTTPDLTMEDGRIVARVVDVYRCEGCGHRVSMAGDRLLNSYPVPRPRDVVRELARAWDVKPLLPEPTEDL